MGHESNLTGDSEGRLIANLRVTHLNRLAAEWKTIAAVGEPYLLSTEWFQPFERTGLLFVAPRLEYGGDRLDAFLPGGEEEVVRVRRRAAGLDLGVQFRNLGEIRLGVIAGRWTVLPETTSLLQHEEHDLGGARVRLALDLVDNVFFPTSGNLTTLEIFLSRDALGADRDYDRLRFATLHAWTTGRNTVIGGLQFGSDLDSGLPFEEQFPLGGFLNLSGLRHGELRDNVLALATLGDYWRIGRLPALGRLYAGAIAQAGNVWADMSDARASDLVTSGTLFCGVDTRLSPLYLGYGYAEGGKSQVYVFLGNPFWR
jgi:NTE family protein